MNIEIGSKPIDFVFQGDELIYPNYAAKDNLVLHYDFSGRTNLDVKKGIAEDLSGNGNDGILENFAYESGSGYDSNSYLEFDNVDDFITIPELNLDVNNFTVAVDGQILSYRGDNVAKINENGLEIGGRNLLRNSAFLNTTDWWVGDASILSIENNVLKISFVGGASTPGLIYSERISLNAGTYTLGIKGNYDNITNKVWRLYFIDGEIGDYETKSIVIKSGWNYNTITFTITSPIINSKLYLLTFRPVLGDYVLIDYLTLVEGSKSLIDWTPAPEDVQTTRITPFFSNKIKTLMYWNRALTDVELQEVYNVQKHRI